MKQELNLTLQRSNAPTLQRNRLIFVLLAVLFATTFSIAQGTDQPPYNPCAASHTLAAHCLDGSRTCNYYSQFACSEGYCWALGVPGNNAGIPPNGLVQNKTIEIGGVYTITQGVTFKNCLFKMRGDARINISPNDINHSLIKINFDNCDFFGCGEMWQGIVVDGTNAQNGLFFNFFNSSIEDAYIGLTLNENEVVFQPQHYFYNISRNTFRNNHIGISNLRQNGNFLNAVLVRNQFFQTANLATQVGSLAGLVLPDYPLAYAGIKYVNLNTVIGVDQHGQQNDFSCLVNGIVLDRSRVVSTNNFFHDISANGIWSTGVAAQLKSTRCRFYLTGGFGIRVEGSTLDAQLNSFAGDWEEGIHAIGGNNNEHFWITNGNTFDMSRDGWHIGIYVERPQGGLPSFIDGNTFTVKPSSNATDHVNGIRVMDFVDAATEMTISNNVMTFNGSTLVTFPMLNEGIVIGLGNSDNINVHDNHLSFGTINNSGEGIDLYSPNGQNFSTGHIVRHNDVTGISTTPDLFTNPLDACFRGFRVQGVEFCDNTADQSIEAFRFLGPCDIALRNNHINNHFVGLEIGGVGGRIGKQEGRGNEWALNSNACVQFAAIVFNSNPFQSEFVVPEGNILPWLPLNAKLDPDPSIINWFHFGNVPLVYCVPMATPLPRKLTPYEKEAVLGTSTFTGISLWDLKREVYAKLLIFPSLRPSGSPEATFFNSLSNTAMASLGNVLQQARNALTLTTAYQQTYNTYDAAVELAFANLKGYDANMDYSSPDNLTETWFAQRDYLLQQLIVNAVNETALLDTRIQQLTTGLQSALNYNTAISTAQAYESARKTIYELRISHLLGQPITQSLYQQALSLAQQGEAIVGKAASEAVSFLAPCDQKLFQLKGEGQVQSLTRGNQSSSYTTQLQIAPNPTTGLTEITLSESDGGWLVVYNISGQKVKTLSIAPETSSVTLDLEQNPNGLYWLVFSDTAGKVIGTAKISVSH